MQRGEGGAQFFINPIDILAEYAIITELLRAALIAQSVERILGKDEVSSSNLDKSSRQKNQSLDWFFYLQFSIKA